jgi:hypothetical protein
MGNDGNVWNVGRSNTITKGGNMKKLLIALMLLFATTANAGEILTMPFNVVVSEPVTDVVELKQISLVFGDSKESTIMSLTYTVYNPNRTVPLVEYNLGVIDDVFDVATWVDIKEGIVSAIETDIASRLPTVPK